jgi:hypothetical protein
MLARINNKRPGSRGASRLLGWLWSVNRGRVKTCHLGCSIAAAQIIKPGFSQSW